MLELCEWGNYLWMWPNELNLLISFKPFPPILKLCRVATLPVLSANEKYIKPCHFSTYTLIICWKHTIWSVITTECRELIYWMKISEQDYQNFKKSGEFSFWFRDIPASLKLTEIETGFFTSLKIKYFCILERKKVTFMPWNVRISFPSTLFMTRGGETFITSTLRLGLIPETELFYFILFVDTYILVTKIVLFSYEFQCLLQKSVSRKISYIPNVVVLDWHVYKIMFHINLICLIFIIPTS